MDYHRGTLFQPAHLHKVNEDDMLIVSILILLLLKTLVLAADNFQLWFGPCGMMYLHNGLRLLSIT